MKKNLLILSLLTTYFLAPTPAQTTPEIFEPSQALVISGLTIKALTSAFETKKNALKTTLKGIGISCAGSAATMALNAAATEIKSKHAKTSILLRGLSWTCYVFAQNSFNPWTEGTKALKLGLWKSFKNAITTRHTQAQRLTFAINTFGPLACTYFYKNKQTSAEESLHATETIIRTTTTPAHAEELTTPPTTPRHPIKITAAMFSPGHEYKDFTMSTPKRPKDTPPKAPASPVHTTPRSSISSPDSTPRWTGDEVPADFNDNLNVSDSEEEDDLFCPVFSLARTPRSDSSTSFSPPSPGLNRGMIESPSPKSPQSRSRTPKGARTESPVPMQELEDTDKPSPSENPLVKTQPAKEPLQSAAPRLRRPLRRIQLAQPMRAPSGLKSRPTTKGKENPVWKY